MRNWTETSWELYTWSNSFQGQIGLNSSMSSCSAEGPGWLAASGSKSKVVETATDTMFAWSVVKEGGMPPCSN